MGGFGQKTFPGRRQEYGWRWKPPVPRGSKRTRRFWPRERTSLCWGRVICGIPLLTHGGLALSMAPASPAYDTLDTHTSDRSASAPYGFPFPIYSKPGRMYLKFLPEGGTQGRNCRAAPPTQCASALLKRKRRVRLETGGFQRRPYYSRAGMAGLSVFGRIIAFCKGDLRFGFFL